MLQPRQQRFVDEYLIDLNATQAAVRAGYSKKTARQIASENLSKLDIQAEIARRQKERRRQYRLSHERILKEITRIAFFRIGALFRDDGTLKPVNEWNAACESAVASFETTEIKAGGKKTGVIRKVKLHDKMAALEKAGKHAGLFKERPTLEDMLALLPRTLADALREEFRRQLDKEAGSEISSIQNGE